MTSRTLTEIHCASMTVIAQMVRWLTSDPAIVSCFPPTFPRRQAMALVAPIEYESASPAVRAVYEDIRTTRNTDYVNNFWKVLANDPAALERTWATVKQVMAP